MTRRGKSSMGNLAWRVRHRAAGVSPRQRARPPSPNQNRPPQGGQPGERGVPVEKSAPSRATTGEEFLVRHAAMEAAARESSAVQSITDPPPSGNPASAGLPQGDAGPLAVTAGVSQPPGPPLQAGGEVVESHAPQQSAFGNHDPTGRRERPVPGVGGRACASDPAFVPESLGEVRVELVSVRDELHLRLSRSASVRDAMESGSDALRNALAKDGVNLIRVTVSATVRPPRATAVSGRGHGPMTAGFRYAGLAACRIATRRRPARVMVARAAWHEGKLSVTHDLSGRAACTQLDNPTKGAMYERARCRSSKFRRRPEPQSHGTPAASELQAMSNARVAHVLKKADWS